MAGRVADAAVVSDEYFFKKYLQIDAIARQHTPVGGHTEDDGVLAGRGNAMLKC